MKKQIDLSITNYGTVKDLKYEIVLLPWGATEPHNYHLPYLTDSILSHAIAVDTAEAVLQNYNVRCMVMPPVNFGSQNPGQKELPFCIHTRQSTQQAILEDIVSSLYVQGIRKMLIINGHGGNNFKGMIRDLSQTYPDFLIFTTEWYTVVPAKEHFEAEIDDHAGETETSVMMYYYPELVNLSEAGSGNSTKFAIESLNKKIAWAPRNWQKISKDTGVGNPMKATAEKGKDFAEIIVDKLTKLLWEIGTKDLY